MLNYFSRLLRWVRRAAFVSSSFVFFGLCIYLFIASGATECKARIVGALFQGVGLLFAGYALYKTEIDFQYPTPIKRIMSWIKDSPPYKIKPLVMNGAVVAKPNDVDGRIDTDVPIFENIQDRIKYLEGLSKSLSEQISLLNKTVKIGIDGVSKQINEESGVITAELSRVNNVVVNSAVGGAVYAELGILYFFASCIFLSFPQELACLLK